MKASRILSRLRRTQPPARPHRARKSLFRFFYYGESEISPVGRPQFRRAAMVKNKRGVGDHPTPRDWLAIGKSGNQTPTVLLRNRSTRADREAGAGTEGVVPRFLAARRDLQRLIGNVEGEDLFLNLLDHLVLHGIDPLCWPTAPAVSRLQEKNPEKRPPPSAIIHNPMRTG